MITEVALIKVRRNRDETGSITEIVACGNGIEEPLATAWYATDTVGEEDWLQEQLHNIPTMIAEHWPEMRGLLTGIDCG
jgi:hypothetical protein